MDDAGAAGWMILPMKSLSTSVSFVPGLCCSSHRLFRALALLASVGALSVGVFAQNAAPNDPNGGGRRRGGGADANGADNGGRGGRGNFDPAAMQEQMMTRMKEQFAVTDDAEWALISERITKVNEIRRTAGGGGGGRGGFPGGGGPGGGGGDRGGGRGTRASGNPEVDSLRSAVTDKLPDAEIKSRLARLREVRQENEAKLTKAQEDLRSVLSVRQEAMAVMFGLLP